MLYGGLLYSAGAVLEFLRWPVFVSGVIGPHEVFHLFVVAGATAHWFFVFKWAAHPIRDIITFHVRVFPNNIYSARAVGESLALEAPSLEGLHDNIKALVQETYHQSLKPRIHLKYFHEEIL